MSSDHSPKALTAPFPYFGGKRRIAKKAGSAGIENAGNERIWFSPHCLRPLPGLFE